MLANSGRPSRITKQISPPRLLIRVAVIQQSTSTQTLWPKELSYRKSRFFYCIYQYIVLNTFTKVLLLDISELGLEQNVQIYRMCCLRYKNIFDYVSCLSFSESYTTLFMEYAVYFCILNCTSTMKPSLLITHR